MKALPPGVERKRLGPLRGPPITPAGSQSPGAPSGAISRTCPLSAQLMPHSGVAGNQVVSCASVRSAAALRSRHR